MKKEDFRVIIDNLNNKIDECRRVFKPFLEGKTMDDLTIREFKMMRETASLLQSDQDKVFIDYRHMLGMLPMSAAQLSQLARLIGVYSSFRSWIKHAAMDSTTIGDYNSESEYNTQVLGSYVLNSRKEYCTREEKKNIELEPALTNTITTTNDVKRYFNSLQYGGKDKTSLVIHVPLENLDKFEEDIILAYSETTMPFARIDIESERKLRNGEKPGTIIFYGLTMNQDKTSNGVYFATVGKSKRNLLFSYLKSKYNIKK